MALAQARSSVSSGEGGLPLANHLLVTHLSKSTNSLKRLVETLGLSTAGDLEAKVLALIVTMLDKFPQNTQKALRGRDTAQLAVLYGQLRDKTAPNSSTVMASLLKLGLPPALASDMAQPGSEAAALVGAFTALEPEDQAYLTAHRDLLAKLFPGVYALQQCMLRSKANNPGVLPPVLARLASRERHSQASAAAVLAKETASRISAALGATVADQEGGVPALAEAIVKGEAHAALVTEVVTALAKARGLVLSEAAVQQLITGVDTLALGKEAADALREARIAADTLGVPPHVSGALDKQAREQLLAGLLDGAERLQTLQRRAPVAQLALAYQRGDERNLPTGSRRGPGVDALKLQQ